MKNLLKKLVEVAYGAKVHASHSAIKGKKSSGKEDSFSSDKNWKSLDNDRN